MKEANTAAKSYALAEGILFQKNTLITISSSTDGIERYQLVQKGGCCERAHLRTYLTLVDAFHKICCHLHLRAR